jgi:hypothetical protein
MQNKLTNPLNPKAHSNNQKNDETVFYRNQADLDFTLIFWRLVEDVYEDEDKNTAINHLLNVHRDFNFKGQEHDEILKHITGAVEELREYTNPRLQLYNLAEENCLKIQKDDGYFLTKKETKNYLQNQILDIFSYYEHPTSYALICDLFNSLKIKPWSFEAVINQGIYTLPHMDKKYIPKNIDENKLRLKPVDEIYKFRKNVDDIVEEIAQTIITTSKHTT